MPERMWQWQRRIAFGSGRLARLDWGTELWVWDVSAYESADGIRLAKMRQGRTFNDGDVLFEATFTLLKDVVDATGGLEAAHKRFIQAIAAAQDRLDRFIDDTGYTKSGPDPEFGWNFSDVTLEDAWYALEEMIIWARTMDDRLKREARDKKRHPDQGLNPGTC
jgi:hypothetical protein